MVKLDYHAAEVKSDTNPGIFLMVLNKVICSSSNERKMARKMCLKLFFKSIADLPICVDVHVDKEFKMHHCTNSLNTTAKLTFAFSCRFVSTLED